MLHSSFRFTLHPKFPGSLLPSQQVSHTQIWSLLAGGDRRFSKVSVILAIRLLLGLAEDHQWGQAFVIRSSSPGGLDAPCMRAHVCVCVCVFVTFSGTKANG